MSAEQRNLERLKGAYRAWNDSRGNSIDVWSDLLADSVRVNSVDEASNGLEFARDRVSRADALTYFSGILDAWEMQHFTPETFIAEGDSIAMFGRCAWRCRKTGKVAECRIANLWKFKGDKAVEFTDLFDSAVAAKAATPD
jgi:ketosteroid isomerase-like protein